MSRYDLTDFEWRLIEPLLPNKPRGVPRVDDRRVLNGIFWVLRSGAPGATFPSAMAREPPYNRFVRWRTAGVWGPAVSAAHDGEIQMIDSTSVRAHQQAATVKKGGRSLPRSIARRAHVVVDAQGIPILLCLTAGQTHDRQIADRLLDHLGPRAG